MGDWPSVGAGLRTNERPCPQWVESGPHGDVAARGCLLTVVKNALA
jgi:hypothetical protein